jgi:hypothetical protein
LIDDIYCKRFDSGTLRPARYLFVKTLAMLPLMILKIAIDGECHIVSMRCAAFVGANSFAHNTLFGRINSPLPPRQLRFLG